MPSITLAKLTVIYNTVDLLYRICLESEWEKRKVYKNQQWRIQRRKGFSRGTKMAPQGRPMKRNLQDPQCYPKQRGRKDHTAQNVSLTLLSYKLQIILQNFILTHFSAFCLACLRASHPQEISGSAACQRWGVVVAVNEVLHYSVLKGLTLTFDLPTAPKIKNRVDFVFSHML